MMYQIIEMILLISILALLVYEFYFRYKGPGTPPSIDTLTESNDEVKASELFDQNKVDPLVNRFNQDEVSRAALFSP